MGQLTLTAEQGRATDVVKDDRVYVIDSIKILKMAVGSDTFE